MLGLTVLAVMGGVLAAWIGLAWWLDRAGRQPSPRTRYDAIVVAGCAVWPGGVPSPALQRRVRRAVDLYEEGWAPRIVLTGGVGTHPPAEAEVAARLCRQWGVPEAALIREPWSTDTRENARYAARLVQGSVLVVTDPFHVARCRVLFRRYFAHADAVGAVGGSRRLRARGSLREAASVVRHRMLWSAVWAS